MAMASNPGPSGCEVPELTTEPRVTKHYNMQERQIVNSLLDQCECVWFIHA